MLYSYLRLRIKKVELKFDVKNLNFFKIISIKIEKLAWYILEEDKKRGEETRSKLSPEEYAYATELTILK